MAGGLQKFGIYLGLVPEPEIVDEVEPLRQAVAQSPVDVRDARVGRTPAAVSPAERLAAPISPEVPPLQDVYRITTMTPRAYNDARRLGEEFRDGIPVIVNLGEMHEAEAKRIVDFISGLAFGLHGSIEKIARNVFLLSPRNVDVSAEIRAQIVQDGFFNQS